VFFTNGAQSTGAQLFLGEFRALLARHAFARIAITLGCRSVAVLLARTTRTFTVTRFVLATLAVTGGTTVPALTRLPLTTLTVTLLPVTRGATLAITLRASAFAWLALSRATISSWRAGSTSARTV
jgi:hypothetical protein